MDQETKGKIIAENNRLFDDFGGTRDAVQIARDTSQALFNSASELARLSEALSRQLRELLL